MSYGDAGGAVGYLIGEANQGMRYMFTMMNTARLSVGLLREKIDTARFYAGQLLPQAAGLLPAITAGAGPFFQVDLSRATPG